MTTFNNPIIPGFHPDPSICRVGEDYYLVTSSFEFFPGVPLFHSRDLINWEQIGHVLSRRSQLELEGCHPSGGIYAPTLRYNNGRFYMTTTNVSDKGNFFVWTDDITGEWSEPVWVKQGGIDPSFFFDDDGTVFFTSTFQNEEGPGIGQCVLDIETGKMLTETILIWHGTGGKCPEGPHMYKRDGYYYLMIAEGGTEYGHMETIARSKSPWGPFEECPRNPILSHRDVNMGESPFQGLGHADIVETPEGESWIVFHGIRPAQGRLHHIGRETLIAKLVWDDEGWPVINGGEKIMDAMSVETKIQSAPVRDEDIKDDFDSGSLAYQWSFLRNPAIENYNLSDRPSYLGLISGNASLDDMASPTFLGRRQQHFDIQVQTKMDFEPKDENQQAGVTVYHTYENHYDLIVKKKDNARVAVLRKHVGDMIVESESVHLPEEGEIILKIEADKLIYSFFAGTDENSMKLVGTGRSQFLAKESMKQIFTGCFVGMFAQGGATAWFDYFIYDNF